MISPIVTNFEARMPLHLGA